MTKNITFRTHLLGNVVDFASSCDMKPFVEPAFLVELVVCLARYREEGIKLSPQIFLCQTLNQILSRLPDSDFVKIGECSISENSVSDILKKCAPLAIDDWCVFIEGTPNILNYGVFRGSPNIMAVPIDITLFSSDSGDTKLVRLNQTANDCIEIMNHCGEIINIILSQRKENTPHPKQYVNDLVKSICEQVAVEVKETTETYIRKSLVESLSKSHGCLIAVCRKLPKILNDGVFFSPPIDFAKEIKRCKDNVVSPNISALRSYSSLLQGTLSCDGIVVFSRDAKLLAYRCFVSAPQKLRIDGGGARRRAFKTLCDKINRGIYAAFIQSQDGYTDFRRFENDI